MEKILTKQAYEIIEDMLSKQYFVYDWVELAPLIDRMPLTTAQMITIDPSCWLNWQTITQNKEYLHVREAYDSALKFLVHYTSLLGPDVIDKILGFFTFQRWLKAFREYEKSSM